MRLLRDCQVVQGDAREDKHDPNPVIVQKRPEAVVRPALPDQAYWW